MKEIIDKLTCLNKTIASMESCTGGGLVNAITNIEGASEVIKYSAVTYSNEYKIKMGVSKDIIDKYTVYSMETARNMAFCISEYAQANLGIGITGKLNKVDNYNPYGDDGTVFVSIFDKDNNTYYDLVIKAIKENRMENKNLIIEEVIKKIKEILDIK